MRALVSAGRRLEMPPADDLPRYEAGPVAETGDLSRGCEPTAVLDLHLRAIARAAVSEVAHYLGVGI